MNKNYFHPVLLLLIALFFNLTINAQKQNFWQVNNDYKKNSQPSTPVIFYKKDPKVSTIIDVDLNTLKALLQNIPQRGRSNKGQGVTLAFPNQNGKSQRFLVKEASVFSPSLQAQFPNIRSFSGKGIDNPKALIRFSLSPQKGLSAMVLSDNKTVFIEPYTQDLGTYISFVNSKEDLPYASFTCEFEEDEPKAQFGQNKLAQAKNANDQTLRTYRLALACTGEYAQFHGGTIASVNAAYNATMTRVNGIYEKEMAITMVIVPNNNNIIHLNGTTDPYTNNNGGVMLNQNQTTCDAIIGSANYDIGHVFSTGGGGVAQLNSPCTNGKARGVTGLGSPRGDAFDVDYVCHEMGHQYGATHTQNNNCQRTLSTSIEPGSASTIMGYAGICPPNIQGNSDDYFSTASINQMWNNVSGGSGSSCFTGSSTGNQAPVANAGSNYSIPRSTAFVLKGSATDPDTATGSLTYCWEQTDTTPATMPPSSTSTEGPLFRSLDPSSSSNRYMPPLSTVMSGSLATTWEVVPSVARTMNFDLTVRDNETGGGATSSDAMVVTVENVTPFTVNNPSNWGQGNNETLNWVVGNTNIAPINCANVNILLTTNAGSSFTTLASNVPNNGTATVTIPGIPDTSNAQILVEAADNIFYAVSNTFQISSTFSVNENSNFNNLSVFPNPNKGSFNITFDSLLNDDVNVDVFDIRGRLIHNQGYPNSIKFDETLTLNNPSSGVYLVKIQQASNVVTKRVIVE